MNKLLRELLSRRRFIEGMTALGLSALVTPLLSCGSDPGAESSSGSDSTTFPFQVYRFQTRGTEVCAACRNHARYKVFLDAATADQKRAHGGCNCRIVTQPITAEYWQMVAPYEQGGVIELRQIYT
jgi:hypothetical protein